MTSTVYINLDYLAHNFKLLQQLAGQAAVWPVVKANAYGHDAQIIVRKLTYLGADCFCVAHLQEAVALRRAGIQARFIILLPSSSRWTRDIIHYDLEPMLCTYELADSLGEEAAQVGKRVNIHVKIDSGLGRNGVQPDEIAGFLAHCRAHSGLNIAAMMSHFACADETDKTNAEQQIAIFHDALAGLDVPPASCRHMCNSAGLFDLPQAHFDAVRPGIALYGLAPSLCIANPIVKQLKPVLQWSAKIAMLKSVPKGTALGYGATYRTESEALIATVPVGYGDGLFRHLSGKFEMLVGGKRCPQVGMISMDQSLVDVTALGNTAAIGDEVIIIGRQGVDEISAWELAAKAGTISYEIVSAISSRVPRIAMAG